MSSSVAETPATDSPGAQVLAGLAVPGLDLDKARHMVDVRAARRLRRRRTVWGAAAAVVLVGIAVWAWPRPDPQELVADGDRDPTTTTTTPVTASSTVPVLTTVVPTTVPSSTTAAPTVTTVPPTTSTTTAPNQPMAVTAQIVPTPGGAPPRVGETVTVRVNWSDPDLADPATVDVRADFGDPLVTRALSTAARPPCTARGGGAAALVDVPFRYASSGPRTVQVEVTACDGVGPYGERKVVQVPVQVQAPETGRRAVVIGGGDGRSPDSAAVLAGVETVARRDPELTQVLPDGTTRATVAVIDAAYAGPLHLRWGEPPGASCQVTASDQSVTAVEPPDSRRDHAVGVRLAPGPAACPTQAGAGAGTRP